MPLFVFLFCLLCLINNLTMFLSVVFLLIIPKYNFTLNSLLVFLLKRFMYYTFNKIYTCLLEIFKLSRIYIVIDNYCHIIKGKFLGNSKKILTHIPIRQSIIFPNNYIYTNDKYISKLVEYIINLDKEIKKIRLKLKDSDFRDSELEVNI